MQASRPAGRVLIVAGSDPSGGAGIQADIKTVTALGGYAATAITALTVQNTRGVTGVHPVPSAIIRDQMIAVLSDIGCDAIKTGMLGDADVIEVVAQTIDSHGGRRPLVVDPVMVAKGGAPLLPPDAVATLKRDLIVRASVLTPNLPEAAVLGGRAIHSLDEMQLAAEMLLSMGPRAVVLKGGHLATPEIHDVLATPDGIEVFSGPRIETNHTHGTGCTLASSIACGLAQGLALRDAVIRARAFVLEAIRTAPGFGAGHGPINHQHAIPPFTE